MQEYIAFDSHKRYTWVEHQEANTGKTRAYRLEHGAGAIGQALAGCAPGTTVAIEATANWYWIIDEIEQAGCVAGVGHPRKAKLMMGVIKTPAKLGRRRFNSPRREWT